MRPRILLYQAPEQVYFACRHMPDCQSDCGEAAHFFSLAGWALLGEHGLPSHSQYHQSVLPAQFGSFAQSRGAPEKGGTVVIWPAQMYRAAKTGLGSSKQHQFHKLIRVRTRSCLCKHLRAGHSCFSDRLPRAPQGKGQSASYLGARFQSSHEIFQIWQDGIRAILGCDSGAHQTFQAT